MIFRFGKSSLEVPVFERIPKELRLVSQDTCSEKAKKPVRPSALCQPPTSAFQLWNEISESPTSSGTSYPPCRWNLFLNSVSQHIRSVAEMGNWQHEVIVFFGDGNSNQKPGCARWILVWNESEKHPKEILKCLHPDCKNLCHQRPIFQQRLGLVNFYVPCSYRAMLCVRRRALVLWKTERTLQPEKVMSMIAEIETVDSWCYQDVSSSSGSPEKKPWVQGCSKTWSCGLVNITLLYTN